MRAVPKKTSHCARICLTSTLTELQKSKLHREQQGPKCSLSISISAYYMHEPLVSCTVLPHRQIVFPAGSGGVIQQTSSYNLQPTAEPPPRELEWAEVHNLPLLLCFFMWEGDCEVLISVTSMRRDQLEMNSKMLSGWRRLFRSKTFWSVPNYTCKRHEEKCSSSRQLQVSYITASLAEIQRLAQGHFRRTDASKLLYSSPAAKPPANSRLPTLAVG